MDGFYRGLLAFSDGTEVINWRSERAACVGIGVARLSWAGLLAAAQ